MSDILWQQISKEYFDKIKNLLVLTEATGSSLMFYVKKDGTAVIKKQKICGEWKYFRRKDVSVL